MKKKNPHHTVYVSAQLYLVLLQVY